jgi:putative membrane-bound dehydrogenase-like protein
VIARKWQCAATIVVLTILTTSARAEVQPRYASPLITAKTPGHAVEIDVDIRGAKQLFLVVDDGGDGISADWVDWAEPRLIGPSGERKLTEIKWTRAESGWRGPAINESAGGKPMRINGQTVDYGIGTHAKSIIEFDLPSGYDRFRARAGLDNGGTDQNGQGSARFLVYAEQPPASVFQPAPVAGREAADAVANLDVAPGLEATLFAAEPMLLSPSDLDIDHRGRVWVCEVVNYRHRAGSRPEGDRILILEDTDHDGRADKSTVFYQGTDIDSALGICVLGNRVIVSVAPNVFVLTDENGDGKADKKELLFSKTGQAQHDHSVHAFVFGPDGKLYWNMGNTGHAVFDKDGKPVVDLEGNVVNDSAKPYRQGMAFRCNLDGSEFEVLGWNFRNNYELAVDSFGTVWQSDNDDDGNRGVRINYVMEHGNYGYTDEMTGAGWKVARTNLEAEIPLQHWHQNDPGVVPNLLLTGGGSPTGICVYEGKLLPPIFCNQVIHTDAGPNVCRAYPATNSGAGYKAEMVDILAGPRDNWFRPSDVCVAPDGSLIVADWYDPGVGGHRMGDIDKGRLFRVAPPKVPYSIPQLDFNTAEGAIEALKSPNHETRYLAWTALHNMQAAAEPALLKLYGSDNPRQRARALWLLSKIDGRGRHFVETALADRDADLRITGLRAARELKLDLPPYVKQLAHDPSAQVRRECVLALRHNKSPEAAQLWAELATQHDGLDRWYLEALGTGADQQWDGFLDAWLAKVGDRWNTAAGRDILWRSRAAKTPEYLARIIADPATSLGDLPRYFRAFDFLNGEGKDRVITELAFAGSNADKAKQSLIMAEAIDRLTSDVVAKNPALAASLGRILDQTRGSEQYVRLVDKFSLVDRYPELLSLAEAHPEDQIGVEAIRMLLAKQQQPMIKKALAAGDAKVNLNLVRVLGNSGDGRAGRFLLPLVTDSHAAAELRQEAIRGLAHSRNGATELLKLADQKKVEANLLPVTAFALQTVVYPDLKLRIEKLFPLPPSKNAKPLPPLATLLQTKGDMARGKVVFNTTGTCAKCHIVGGEGKEVGPNLSEIGGKLSREAMFESILYPSAGISHNYEASTIVLDSGNIVTGIITSQTADAIAVKGIDAIVRTYKKSEVDQIEKQTVSLMPADLQKVLSVEELIDVVEYMTTLKPARPAASTAQK